MNVFTHRDVPCLGRRLLRLGLSGSFGLDEAGCREALDPSPVRTGEEIRREGR